MKQHKDILIKQSFDKADEAIESAKLNLENNHLSTAQNRIYYAIFYSVLALGYSREFVTSKHGQLLGWFNRVFIYEEKLFSPQLTAIYKESFENRNKSDYQLTWKPDKNELIKSIELANDFIQAIRCYLKNN